MGALVSALLVTGSGLSARAGDTFSLKNGALVGNFDLPLAELPPALSGQALIGDPSSQDLYVLGLIGDGVVGAAPTPVAVRYGRRLGRGDARIIVGPAPLTLPMMLQSGATLRGGVARSAGGDTLALGLSSSPALYFYDTRTLAPQSVAALGTQVSLAASGLSPALTKLTSVTGLGTKVYASDGVSAVVAQVDLMSGTVKACAVDAPVLGLRSDSGKVVATTSTGTVTLADPCAAVAASTGAAAAAPSPLSATLPLRGFDLSERVLEMTFPVVPAGTKARRGLIVSTSGSPSAVITIGAGTCLNTKFYAGDVTGTAVATNTITLTAAVPRQAFYAEQTSPGEECVAVLTSAGVSGEALVRIRGAVEGLGANVALLDRSYSMERSMTGSGAAATPEQSRVYAMRQAVAALLSTVTVMPAAGPWAFVPFTSDVQSNLATPGTGFSQLPTLSNPDSPGGMRVRGFATASSDNLDPGGSGDLVQAMRSSFPRLLAADQPMYASAGPLRRLWVFTDGSSGSKGFADFHKLLPSLLRGGVSLHLTGIGGLENDPLMQQMVALGTHLDGERLFAPAVGQLGILHTPTAVVENLVSTLSRSVLRGRPIGTMGRGGLQTGQDLTTTFTLTRDPTTGAYESWVLFAAAWDSPDATVTLKITDSGFPINPRCLRAAQVLICAALGFDGDYKATLSGSRPSGAPTAAVLRTFVSSGLAAGEIGFFPSLARSLYRTGDQVRVQLLLNERGLPLRGAKVTAKVSGPSAALGSLVAQGAATPGDIAALISSNGDLSPGQAKAELLDPATLPTQRLLQAINLFDDATGGDLEPQDGVYAGQFVALVPGVYLIDIHAEFTGAFGTSGTIEDRLVTQVVVGLDKTLTAGSVLAAALPAGGLRLRFTPQDAGKNLLGPGQAGALSFAQGGKLFAPLVSDYLDGSYRADVSGIDTSQPLDLLAPGSRIQVWDPATSPISAAGCSAAPALPGGPLNLTLTLGLALMVLAIRRRRVV